jgi:hypothetical protein
VVVVVEDGSGVVDVGGGVFEDVGGGGSEDGGSDASVSAPATIRSCEGTESVVKFSLDVKGPSKGLTRG